MKFTKYNGSGAITNMVLEPGDRVTVYVAGGEEFDIVYDGCTDNQSVYFGRQLDTTIWTDDGPAISKQGIAIFSTQVVAIEQLNF